jgi:hypothetical protein
MAAEGPTVTLVAWDYRYCARGLQRVTGGKIQAQEYVAREHVN